MVNFRIAYDRFMRAAKKKNLADGLVDRNMFNDVEGEVHHMLPKSLGGSNKFKNLVVLSHEDHVYAHILLNLAFIQEKNTEALSKLSYHNVSAPDGCRAMFKKKHPFRGLKVDVYINEKPMAMGIDEAARYFCFAAHRNINNELLLNGMFATIVKTAMTHGSKYGYKIAFHI